MQLTIHAQAELPGIGDDVVSVSGDMLIVNYINYDLSSVPEGGEAQPSQGSDADVDHPFVGAIRRVAGEIHCAIRFRYDTSTAEPVQPKERRVISVASGQLPDPILRKQAQAVVYEEHPE